MQNLTLEQIADNAFNKGELYTAEQFYMKILAKNPKNLNALYKLGFINVGKMDYENAEMLLDAALKVGADFKTLKLLAYVKEKRFKLYDAIVMYEQLLELEPSESLFEIIADLYIQLELYDNALHISREYVQKFPTIFAYRRLFLILLNLGKVDELKELKEDIKIKFPNKGLAFNLLGMYKEYIELDLNEAEKLYEKAVKLGVPTATFDLAQCYKKLKKYDEAEKSCKKILDTYPRKNDVINLLKDISFIQRKMRKGYKYYLERDLNEDIKNLKNKWDGKIHKDKTILVISDFSDADCIRNLRYINSLSKSFKNVIVSASVDLLSFLTVNHFNVISNSEIYSTEYDYYVLLSELPYYLNSSFELIPKLKLSAEKIDLDSKSYKIGLYWKSSGDSMKAVNISSIDLTKYFDDLFKLENVEFYSFQKNDIFSVLEKYPQVVDLSKNLNDINDYAKYINSMDLIISIDSHILHLAGVLDKKAVGLIPFDFEWYWFDNDDESSDWYSSLELYRQKFGEDCTDVSNKVVKRVKALIKK